MSIIKVITTAFKWVFLVLLAYILFVEVVLRIVRRFYQFPIPAFVARLIDNPIRRRIQPPEKIVEWMDVKQGMTILEIGPGPGTFTLEAGRQVGDKGRVYAIDIQESIVSSLGQKIEQQGIINIIVEQASAYDLPYPHSYFDRVYMIAVLGEIPDKKSALAEFRRVLKDDGLLAIGEFLPDPDFPRRKTATAWCQDAGFVLADTYGNLMHYLLLFSNKQ
ncbi:MAG TPA: methyltransferase domain-containing protein [Anaerolineales bacterium]|nr:methyltransferase domain-containing protein [Anaerolineales bacterium]